jgi:stage II sporulation protein D
MRRSAHAAFAVVTALVVCAPAQAATNFTIKGAGYGHGVGMSQFGALGYAQHGAGYRDILGHYYAGTAIGSAASGTIVRVLLASPKVASFTGATKAGDRALRPDQVYRVVSTLDGRLELRSSKNHRLARFDAPLTVTGTGSPLTLRGTQTNGVRDGAYRGWFEFRPSAVGNVLAINAIGLEQYLAGVVAAESPSNWPAAALEAQAVAARTYALTTSAGASQGFTQYADTRSQMYRGVASETASTNAAVNATAGQVVTYGGKPVVTYFFSTSGGRTENVEESVLGTTPRPWLRSVVDPYDNVSPYHRWQVGMTMKQVAKKLGTSLVKGRFQGIVVVERGASPRVRQADVVGSKGRVRTTGAVLRRKLGLRDTWAYFKAITAHKENPETTAPSDTTGGTPPAARAAAADAGGVLAGRVMPYRRGAEVQVQRRVGHAWREAAVTLVGRGGIYRTTVPGPGVYRVVSGGVLGPAVRVGR